ncbi:MAG TPA: phosphatidylserine decarboxylase [Candidatus Nanoarchaeia archaeon]|nr:phosphatidylserine decarboxylase [Candidatus Nanoarchaeia archaeon]
MHILSPADGRITNIIPHGRSLSLIITLNLWHKHYQIAPVDGRIARITYTKGKFLNAIFDRRAPLQNERNEIVMRHKGQAITITQVAGMLARRIYCDVRKGQRVSQGQRLGRIAFGSIVLLTVPRSAKIMATRGRIRIGDTLGHL